MSYNSLVTYVLEGDCRTSFPLTFPIDFTSATIEVWLDGAIYLGTWTYDEVNGEITFTEAPVGSELLLRRKTNVDSKQVTFNARSMLNETELNRSIDQLFFAVQEANDMTSYTVTGNISSLVGAINGLVADAESAASVAEEQVALASAQADRAKDEADRAEFAGDNTVVDVVWGPTGGIFVAEGAMYPSGGSIITLRMNPPSAPAAGTRYALTYTDGSFEWHALT